LLRVIQKLPDQYELNLFGKGELEPEVQALANKIHNVVYHGFIGGKQLVGKLYEMDILLNPHSDISKMQDGVFPFKMLEYIATGSYVITTPLPDLEGVDLSCIATYNYSDAALVEALLDAPKKYSPVIAAQLIENVMHAASFETAKQTITRQLGSLT
jgi:glycosyltransferase involved in cell wall biosynthesis